MIMKYPLNRQLRQAAAIPAYSTLKIPATGK
jgi:hypothetical protein